MKERIEKTGGYNAGKLSERSPWRTREAALELKLVSIKNSKFFSHFVIKISYGVFTIFQRKSEMDF